MAVQSDTGLFSNMSAILYTTIALCILLFISNAIYCLYFHPLHHIPGPKLNAITRIPFTYHYLRGTAPFYSHRLHVKYGSVVRFTPDEVSFTTADSAFQDIYGFRTGKLKAHPNMTKSPGWYDGTASGVPSLLLVDDEEHAKTRKLLSHAFSEKALGTQEPLLQSYVDLLVHRIREKAATGNLVNISKIYEWFTFDVISDLTFGKSFGCLEHDRTHRYLPFMDSLNKGFQIHYLLWYFPLARFASRFFYDSADVRGKMEYFGWVDVATKQRAETRGIRPDFMSYTLKENDSRKAQDKYHLSVDQLTVNNALLIAAGSETTTDLLSAATYLLCRTPHTLERLQKQLRTDMGWESTADITLASVAKATYLNAVINEGLRIFPPVPIGVERRVPRGGMVISGHYIPGGVEVSVSQYAAGHSAENFAEPETFAPERWLGDESFAADKREGVQPFIVGPRACLGRNLAWAEMRLVLAKIVFSFDFELDPTCEDWMSRCRQLVGWKKPPLLLHMTPVTRRRSQRV